MMKIEMKDKIVVTQKCIDDGFVGDPQRHPVAIAMNAYPKKHESRTKAENPYFRNACCWGGSVRFTAVNDETMMGSLDEKGSEWAYTFNADDPVEPIEVVLTWSVEPCLALPIAEHWAGVIRGEIDGSQGAIPVRVVDEISAPVQTKATSKDLDLAPFSVTIPAPPTKKHVEDLADWRDAVAPVFVRARDALSDTMRRRIFSEETVMYVATALRRSNRDLDNVHKLVQDALQQNGVIENDCRVTRIIHDRVQHLSGDEDRVRVILDLREPFKNGPISGGYLDFNQRS